jgi:hypothetical protein
MKPMAIRIWSGVLWGALAGVTLARADVTGSYDGTLLPKKSTESLAAAAAFSQADKLVSGTVALPAALVSFVGAYLVSGKATPRKLKVSGIGPNGVSFKYSGKLVGTTLQGKAKLKGSAGKLRGTLTLGRNAASGDGSASDAVFTANETLFTDQVLGQALASCGSCHAPGLQAGATRLRVDPLDALATARSLALLVDSASPATSRALEKPLNVLPHGGGQQILPASNEEQLLAQWADLIAVAACN